MNFPSDDDEPQFYDPNFKENRIAVIVEVEILDLRTELEGVRDV